MNLGSPRELRLARIWSYLDFAKQNAAAVVALRCKLQCWFGSLACLKFMLVALMMAYQQHISWQVLTFLLKKKFEALFMPSIHKGLFKNFARLWYLNLHLQKDYETSNLTSLCTYSLSIHKLSTDFFAHHYQEPVTLAHCLRFCNANEFLHSCVSI